VEAASGIVLLCAAVVALTWANSPWHASYESFWQLPLQWGWGRHGWTTTLRLIVNDGLMSVFFLVVGLEVRNEIHSGELNSGRRGLVPVMAAAGGVVTPALVYLAIAARDGLGRGWAIPTATDIAFAIGVLALLGSRIPPSVRVLLLALAIIDDVVAVVVIAVFYSAEIHASGFVVAAAGVGIVLLLQRLGVRSSLVYLLPGALLWLGLLLAGVHPTLAGVVLGLLTPATLQRGSAACREDLLSPAARVQQVLHPWVAFGVMPLFALANAGVAFGSFIPHARPALTLTWAIVLALVIGKPVGISVFTWATARSGLGEISEDLTWRGVLLLGCLGGIGFTMSLFLTNLAFADPLLASTGKSAVLLGSALAATAGLLIGRWLLFPGARPPRT
jgi:Na+:H+ antiporter, NhaA family